MKDILKLKASEARKIANKNYSNDFEFILSRIEGAAYLGKTHVYLDYEITKTTIHNLRTYGYDVDIIYHKEGNAELSTSKIGWFNSHLE